MGRREFELRTERLGPLPLLNHYMGRLGLGQLFDLFIPTPDRRTRIPYATGADVVLRSILTEREPLYRLGEVVNTFAPEGFALSAEEMSRFGDDAIPCHARRWCRWRPRPCAAFMGTVPCRESGGDGGDGV